MKSPYHLDRREHRLPARPWSYYSKLLRNAKLHWLTYRGKTVGRIGLDPATVEQVERDEEMVRCAFCLNEFRWGYGKEHEAGRCTE